MLLECPLNAPLNDMEQVFCLGSTHRKNASRREHLGSTLLRVLLECSLEEFALVVNCWGDGVPLQHRATILECLKGTPQ